MRTFALGCLALCLLGGGAVLGPARELAYLDNLLDQDGQFITYRRLGILNSSGKALDQVQLYLAGKQLTRYFDLEISNSSLRLSACNVWVNSRL